MADRTDGFEQAEAKFEHIKDALARLDAAREAKDWGVEEDVADEMLDMALFVEVRSGWTVTSEPLKREEYCILLVSGGPAVRIVGDLNEDREPEPVSASLEYQDWFTPWYEYIPEEDEGKALLIRFAQFFYYGG